MGSLSRTAWQETSSRVFRSGKVKRLEVVEVMTTGVTTVICRQHRSSSSCQGLTGTEQILTSLMVALLGERERINIRDQTSVFSLYWLPSSEAEPTESGEQVAPAWSHSSPPLLVCVCLSPPVTLGLRTEQRGGLCCHGGGGGSTEKTSVSHQTG